MSTRSCQESLRTTPRIPPAAPPHRETVSPWASARPSSLRVSVLGNIQLAAEGYQSGVPSARVRSLLTILALSPGQTVSTATLYREIWSDSSLKNERNAMQAAISRLRRTLTTVHPSGPGDTLRHSPGGYSLHLAPYQVDALSFQSLITRADHERQFSPAEALDTYRQAFHLWRGTPFDDVQDVPLLDIERGRLVEWHVTALEAAAEIQLRLGDLTGSVRTLRGLVERHGDHEKFSEYLMLALYRLGRQSEALTVYTDLWHRLCSRYGIKPGLSIQRMYQLILLQDPSLDEGS